MPGHPAATARWHRRPALPDLPGSSVLRTGAEAVVAVEYAARAGTAETGILIAGFSSLACRAQPAASHSPSIDRTCLLM